jgi:hypothetical protein
VVGTTTSATGLAGMLGVTDENRRWWVLGGMGLTRFMVLFDLTVFVIGIVGIPRRSPDRIPAGSPA